MAKAKPEAHPMRKLLDNAHVVNDGKNDHFRYRFASAEAVFKQLRAGLRESGLHVHSSEIVDVQTGLIRDMQYVTTRIRLTLADDAGNTFGPYEGMGAGADKGDKAPMKSMTSALKYAVAQCCLVSWGDDPEADKSVDKEVEKPAKPDAPAPLTDAAKKELERCKTVAKYGMDALRAHWKDNVAANVQRELSPRSEWADVKKIAEEKDERDNDSGDNGGVQPSGEGADGTGSSGDAATASE